MLPSCFILCGVLLGLTEGAGILPDGPLDAAIGGSVLFSTTKTPPETPYITVNWLVNTTNIGTSTPDSQILGGGYRDRARIFHSNASLELSNLTAADSGEYKVTIELATSGSIETGTIPLSVHEKVSDVTIEPKTVNLVEFNDTLKLTCSSSGSTLSFLWMINGSEVTASDRVNITDGGRSLTIVNVTRDDQGSYTCKASNPVSSATSDPATVTIYYGPENIQIRPAAAEEDHAVGTDITMSCSADSRPSAQFSWFLNGSQLSTSGSELKLMNVQVNDSGSYSCQAFNDKTLRYQTSKPSVINIVAEAISGASVKPTNVPVEGSSVNLTCEAFGPVSNRTWKRNNSDLIPTDNMKLYDNNRVLAFTTVTRNDNGEYVCIMSNPVNSVEARFSLIVNYGPEKVEISGENQIKVGSTIKLICTADSFPLANFTWSLNGTQTLHSSSELIKQNASISDSGTYTCKAANKITGKSASDELQLSVADQPPKKPNSCSAGCIAGIVIGCIALIAIVGGVGYYCFNKKKKAKKSTSTTTGGAHQNTGDSEDVNYSDVRFFRNKQGGVTQLGGQNTATDYAEVRVNNKSPGATSPPSYDAHLHLQRAKRAAPQPDANGKPRYA